MNLVNAELTKIALNTYVTTKITFANMLAEVCERLPGRRRYRDLCAWAGFAHRPEISSWRFGVRWDLLSARQYCVFVLVGEFGGLRWPAARRRPSESSRGAKGGGHGARRAWGKG